MTVRGLGWLAAAISAALGLATASGAQAPPAPAAAAQPGAAAAPAAKPLEAGDTAPAFALQGSDGKTYSLDDFKGRQAVVVAWFPKAFTGG